MVSSPSEKPTTRRAIQNEIKDIHQSWHLTRCRLAFIEKNHFFVSILHRSTMQSVSRLSHLSIRLVHRRPYSQTFAAYGGAVEKLRAILQEYRSAK